MMKYLKLVIFINTDKELQGILKVGKYINQELLVTWLQSC